MPSARFRRRIVSIPAMFGGSLVIVAALPLLLVLAALADLAEGWRRRRFLRLLGVGLTYVVIEWGAASVSALLWVATGFGRTLDSRWSLRRHHRLQMWMVTTLFDAIVSLGDARVTIVGDEEIEPGPIIVLGRHSSFFDALIPVVLVGGGHDMPIRFVLKEELSVLPAFDVVGHRLPNHFVDRAHGAGDAGDVRAITELARGLEPDQAAVIFPEGTFFTPTRHARALERITERSPEHADRAAALRHLLPPRPAGTLALLAGAPEADIVIISHVGFEPFGSMRQVVSNIPFRSPVEIDVRRIPRLQVPADEAGQVDWLWAEWDRMDRWIDDRSPS